MDEGKLVLRHDPSGLLQRLYDSKPKDTTGDIGRSDVCGGENGLRETREGLQMRNTDDELPVRREGNPCGDPRCAHCRSGHAGFAPNLPHIAFTTTVSSRTTFPDATTRRDDGHPDNGKLVNL